MSYAVVRLDNMHGTTDGKDLVSLRYNNGTDEAAIQNGSLVSLSELISRDLWKAVKPTAAQKAIGKLVLVATPELMYDEHKHNYNEFTNEVGVNARGYILSAGCEFSVTAEAFTNGDVPDMTTNKCIQAIAGTTMTRTAVVADAFAELISIEIVEGVSYYVLRVL